MKYTITLTAICCLFLISCSPPVDGAATSDPERLLEQAEAAPDDCLLMVWSQQHHRNVEFDRMHDKVEGGAISCATGTSPSQFDTAIAALREAASSGNRARLLDELGIPLLYIDSQGNRREITDREQVDKVFDEIFDDTMLETLTRLDLSAMTVDKDQGAFFELGALWLVVDEDGGRPRLVTVNRQALDEAMRAAQRQAERKQGDALPLDEG